MKYSIITISFNSEKTIERTIKSVLTQNENDYEYIIVDGASKDSTIDIIKHNESLFEGRLRWISEPDSGIYNAMNKGIAMAKGDVIGIVNSDDWLQPDTLQKVSKYIEDYNLELKTPFIITGNMVFHYEDGTSVVMHGSYKKYEKFAKVYRMGLNHPATFVSKKVYETIGVFDENLRLFADADLITRYYQAELPIYFVDEILSNMKDGGASNSHSKYTLQDNKYILHKYCKSETEYYWLLSKRRALDLIKRISYRWVVKYRELLG